MQLASVKCAHCLGVLVVWHADWQQFSGSHMHQAVCGVCALRFCQVWEAPRTVVDCRVRSGAGAGRHRATAEHVLPPYVQSPCTPASSATHASTSSHRKWHLQHWSSVTLQRNFCLGPAAPGAGKVFGGKSSAFAEGKSTHSQQQLL